MPDPKDAPHPTPVPTVQPNPPITPAPSAKPSPKRSMEPKEIKADMPLACYYSDNGEWIPGKLVSFMGNTTSAVGLIAVADGRLVSVPLSDIRHGEDKPISLPDIQAILPGGVRRSTVRLHRNKWLVASPDGIVKGEHDTEEDANAHLLKIEPPPIDHKLADEAAKKTG